VGSAIGSGAGNRFKDWGRGVELKSASAAFCVYEVVDFSPV